MPIACPICGGTPAQRMVTTRSGTNRALWQCAACDYDFFAHDPAADITADKLDDSRLKSAGLDVPTLTRDFANGTAQSRAYVAQYLDASDRGANVLEVGCSWGYFLQLVREAGARPHGLELNTVRARYVRDELRIPCDVTLQDCEARGMRFRKIFLFYVIEHVPAPVAYLARLMNLLEEGGKLIAVTPNLSDALKDLWRNVGFQRFFYDDLSINYFSTRAVERMVGRLPQRAAEVSTRQGYSFVNHASWFLTQGPRTTGVVGGDNFVRDMRTALEADVGPPLDPERRALAREMADLIGRFDADYRRLMEQHRYGNQVWFVVHK
jgi:hypothetical protein